MNAEAMIRNKSDYGDQVFIIRFEDLISVPESVMQGVSEYLGIGFSESLIAPTFNGSPIKANSSFEVKEHGVIADPVRRYSESLNSHEAKEIEKETWDLYERVLKQVGY